MNRSCVRFKLAHPFVTRTVHPRRPTITIPPFPGRLYTCGPRPSLQPLRSGNPCKALPPFWKGQEPPHARRSSPLRWAQRELSTPSLFGPPRTGSLPAALQSQASQSRRQGSLICAAGKENKGGAAVDEATEKGRKVAGREGAGGLQPGEHPPPRPDPV